jgi:hypothetical protein
MGSLAIRRRYSWRGDAIIGQKATTAMMMTATTATAPTMTAMIFLFMFVPPSERWCLGCSGGLRLRIRLR